MDFLNSVKPDIVTLILLVLIWVINITEGLYIYCVHGRIINLSKWASSFFLTLLITWSIWDKWCHIVCSVVLQENQTAIRA